MSDVRFDDRVVIITGAGNGLGKSHALEFAKRGAKVVVNDLGGSAHGEGASKNAADLVVDEIIAAGGEAVANYNSVTDEKKSYKPPSTILAASTLLSTTPVFFGTKVSRK